MTRCIVYSTENGSREGKRPQVTLSHSAALYLWILR